MRLFQLSQAKINLRLQQQQQEVTGEEEPTEEEVEEIKETKVKEEEARIKGPNPEDLATAQDPQIPVVIAIILTETRRGTVSSLSAVPGWTKSSPNESLTNLQK